MVVTVIVVVSLTGEIQRQWFDKGYLDERNDLVVCIVSVVRKLRYGRGCTYNSRGAVNLCLW